MEEREIILAHGHSNVLATHETTLEITKNAHLSKKGDCVIAVSADKAVGDLGHEFRQSLLRESAKITILIEAGEIAETVRARGTPALILSHPTDIVIRRSSYICNRTLAIHADKAARNLSRRLIEKLKDSGQDVKITLTIEV